MMQLFHCQQIEHHQQQQHFHLHQIQLQQQQPQVHTLWKKTNGFYAVYEYCGDCDFDCFQQVLEQGIRSRLAEELV